MRHLLTILAFTMVACQNQEGQNTESTAASSEEYDKYLESPCQLLTEKMVRKYADNIQGEIKREEHVDTSGMYPVRKCYYNWKRSEEEVKQVKKDAEAYAEKKAEKEYEKIMRKSEYKGYHRNALVGVDNLHHYKVGSSKAQERFKRAYGGKSKAERESDAQLAKKNLKEKYENGELTKEEYEEAKETADVAKKKTAWEPVQGVGDMAYWNTNEGIHSALTVLNGKFRFKLKAYFYYQKPEENKKLAKKLAKDILANL